MDVAFLGRFFMVTKVVGITNFSCRYVNTHMQFSHLWYKPSRKLWASLILHRPHHLPSLGPPHVMNAAWEPKPAFLLNAVPHQHFIPRGAEWALGRGSQMESERVCAHACAHARDNNSHRRLCLCEVGTQSQVNSGEDRQSGAPSCYSPSISSFKFLDIGKLLFWVKSRAVLMWLWIN